MAEEHQTERASQEKKICFVVGPIGEAGLETRRRADWLLKGVIIPTFTEHFPDFHVRRADTISSPGMIDVQLIELLFEAELVIVDMSETNANAFYEMGIRHAFAKPVVHMFAVGTKIPFDVAPHRAIPFSIEHIDDLDQARLALKDAVSEVIKPGFAVVNPVTRALGLKKFETTATPEMQLIWEELSQLRREVGALLPRRTTRWEHHRHVKTLELKVNRLAFAGQDIDSTLRAISPRYGPHSTSYNEDNSIFVRLPGDILEEELQQIVASLIQVVGVFDVSILGDGLSG